MQPDLVRLHRYTVEEYFRMAELGLLPPEPRVELIEGDLIDMAPVGHRHASVSSTLHEHFARELGDHVCIWNQGILQLSASSAPQPDLVLLKGRKDKYRRSPPIPEDALLVVEVSENSLRHDRMVKLPLYAQHNIPEMWIVDVMAPAIHYFRSPDARDYGFSSSTPTPGRISLNRLPDLSIDLTGLLDNLGQRV